MFNLLAKQYYIYLYFRSTNFLFNTKLMQSYQHIKNLYEQIKIIRVEQLRISKGLYEYILANLLFSLLKHHFINNQKDN